MLQFAAETVTHASREVTEALRAMVAAAARAPSGDNLQPWKLALNPARECVEVWLNAATDCSALNSGQRMSLLACGGAIQAAACAASDHGFSARVEYLPQRDTRDAEWLIARVGIDAQARCAATHFGALLQSRCTNRRLYNGRELPAHLLEALKSSMQTSAGVEVHWICERPQIAQLAQLLSRSDSLMFGESAMRRAFLNNVRFDLPVRAEAPWGLPLGVLELSAAQRVTLRALNVLPDGVFAFTPGPMVFAGYARTLVARSSGVCIVSHAESRTKVEHENELSAGRAMLSAWLLLTQHALAVQPMMSAVALRQAGECGDERLVASLGQEKLQRYNAALREALRGMGIAGAPAAILRFGFADAPSLVTGRLPAAQVLRTPAP